MQHTLYILQIIQQYEHSLNFGIEIWTRALSAQSGAFMFTNVERIPQILGNSVCSCALSITHAIDTRPYFNWPGLEAIVRNVQHDYYGLRNHNR